MREFHILSLGAGVQSTTVALLQSFDAAIFADTQEEPAAVYRHLDWLKAALSYPILVRTAGKLGDDLLHGRNSTGQRFAAIPAYTRMGEHLGRTRRQCSREYKTEVIKQTIRREIVGLAPRRPLPRDCVVHQYFGISRDEARRSLRIKERVEAVRGWQAHFPLLECGWTRADCLRFLAARVPHKVPRSACVFCPFKSDQEYRQLKQEEPPSWERACNVDEALRIPGTVANRKMQQAMYIHRSGTPLRTADLNENQGVLGFATECEGVCGN